MKIIKVNSCSECPLKEKHKHDFYDMEAWYCLHPEVEGMELIGLDHVNLYCPLEDFRSKNLL